MTLRLILTRHAKSSWDSPMLDDHDRALNERGYAGAKAIGVWLSQNNFCPDAVFSSTARRTSETWAEIAKSCGNTAKVQFTRDLYMASPDRMLKILQGGQTASVMMISHNPGTGILADVLVKSPPDHPKFAHYPTAATTVISFDVEQWADIKPQSGTVEAFVVPRDLTD